MPTGPPTPPTVIELASSSTLLLSAPRASHRPKLRSTRMDRRPGWRLAFEFLCLCTMAPGATVRGSRFASLQGGDMRLAGRLRLGLVLGFLAVASVPAYAQSGITGVVKDATGAVLPGVTVEASSDVLIEKVRTVATDDAGVYKIIDLRPGTYAVTFTLAGFNSF